MKSSQLDPENETGVERIRIGISTCLLGEQVRYDGGHKLDRYLVNTLGPFVEWVPVCPEVDCGLPIPREAMRLVGDPESPRLLTQKTRIDHTDRMLAWAGERLDELERLDLCGYIFKSRSPSSGLSGVKVYTETGMPGRTGRGIFARAFTDRFPLLPVEDDGRLHDARLRENFIERLFVMHRWRRSVEAVPGAKAVRRALVDFHSDHKLLIMGHSPKDVYRLGKLVASGKEFLPKDLKAGYLEILMDALRLGATVKKNVNVLQHIVGYFKKKLSPDEKQELLEVIGTYHRGLVPLIVPVTLLNHYVRKYDEPYLARQHYLKPHPMELMLRNHA